MLTEDDIADWRRVAPSLVVADVADRAVIYSQGDHVAFLHCVLKGVVKLSHVAKDGRQLTIAVLSSGGVFGTAAAIRPAEHAATAIGEARIVRIAHADIARLVGKNPVFAAFLNQGLEASRERAERKLVDCQTKTVEARLIETLCELALTFGAPCSHGYSLEIPLTQQDIADLVCASRPVVTKIMNALRRRGALDYQREMICVNHAALRSFAGSKSFEL
ncbi:Crp/Fnr family transcriptional regulator [Methylocystis sp. ATCC 49242]|uniref:Crp/Fnr family transcriptional regulator n=1 Tax=Methylocystis sp. ATCC 49242 TaxID=622637 RepID=UPI0001F881D1|nr:Crp/Fnr family transcriptional regulator [Methylocystis sp. ATCC 49242]